ncbi:MAG: hypothetical protein J7L54_06955 [Elusimicrobia bacterium]|nr:hypothetical protein [Elusimicrobiota bacterium]
MLSIIGGLIAAAVGVLWIVPGILGYAWDDVFIVLKGSIALGLIFGGIIAIAAGISALKEKAQEKKEKEELSKEEAKSEEPKSEEPKSEESQSS